MNSRGQGISINMVIIAAIAILVLIIAVILAAKSGKNVDQAAGGKSCAAQGGVCRNTFNCDNKEGEERLSDNPSDFNCNPGYCCRYDFGG